MHSCAIKCCDDTGLSMQGVQNCIENCGGRLQHANNYLQKELNNFQQRVQRCVMDCNDEVKDKMGTNTNEVCIINRSLNCAIKTLVFFRFKNKKNILIYFLDGSIWKNVRILCC